MIRVERLTGVTVPVASGLPRLAPTGAEVALARIPGWLMYLDPASRFVGTAGVLNRAIAGNVLSAQNDAPVEGAFSNAAPALVFNGASNNRMLYGNFDINPAAWTFWAVVRLADVDDGIANLVRPATDTPDGSTSIRVVFNGSGYLRVLDGSDGGQRVTHNDAEAYDGVTCLIMATFSTRDGCRLFRNGTLVDDDTTDKTVLDYAITSGSFRFFQNYSGLVGHAGMHSIDLGWPENAGYRKAIEQAMALKYDLTVDDNDEGEFTWGDPITWDTPIVWG